MHTFVDSSHVVHDNTKGHTRGVATFEICILSAKSRGNMESRSLLLVIVSIYHFLFGIITICKHKVIQSQQISCGKITKEEKNGQ